jgi:hypothetical protein
VRVALEHIAYPDLVYSRPLDLVLSHLLVLEQRQRSLGLVVCVGDVSRDELFPKVTKTKLP